MEQSKCHYLHYRKKFETRTQQIHCETVEAVESLLLVELEEATNVDTVFDQVVKAALVEARQKCAEKREVLGQVLSNT